jgi:trk system potassium uptake protein TrkA
MGIDSLFSPTKLAAEEIARLIRRCSVTDIFDFENGKISIIGITLDDSSPHANQTVVEVSRITTIEYLFRPIAILRGHRTIIPTADTILRRGDHLYCVTKTSNLDHLIAFLGKEIIKVKRLMIVGGKDIGLTTAKLLEDEYHITIVEEDSEQCHVLAENLDNSLIIKGSPSNQQLLKEEGLSKMDAFIALTPSSETNILASLMAGQAGVYKTIALVTNIDYTRISQNIGVDTLINKKLIAANNIFRFVRKGKIEAIMGLHGVDAEVIEFVVEKSNRITKHPVKELHFPKNAFIAGVVRGEEPIIPDGNFQIQLHDKVIVFSLPDAISKVEELFR